jgi:hypothetical protein
MTSLSRPAQASLALRIAGLLNRPRRPSSRGFHPPGYPTKRLVSYQSLPTTPWVEPSSTGGARLRRARRVEERRSGVGRTASPFFPFPLIERSVRISRTTLSDWFPRGHTASSGHERYPCPHVALAPRRSLLGRVLFLSVLHRLAPIHRPSPSSASAPEVKGLPSTGVTRHQQYYYPVRLPPTSPPRATLRPLASCPAGLRLPAPHFQRAAPSTPVDQMGACVDCFPIHAAFPRYPGGSPSTSSLSGPAQASHSLRRNLRFNNDRSESLKPLMLPSAGIA